MGELDEAKQRIKEMSFTIHRDNLSKEGQLLISPTKRFLLDYDVLAVLGDLQAEAQKTWKELFQKFPKPYEDGKELKWFSWIEILEWKEKAEKLLEATK